MKKTLITLLAATSMFAISCKPVRIDPIVEIESNETAFVIPLEGSTSSQKGFDSVDYLEKNQVATKRIVIPQRDRKIGRAPWAVEWIPTAKVLRVNRSPITREWNEKGLDSTPISVESLDSIGFAVGINITAHIEVEDTPKFLYNFREKNLAEVIDTNIRGFLQTQLSEKFGNFSLEDCKSEKNAIMQEAREATVAHFAQYGITISSLGMAEGLSFEQPEIQKAINDTYVAEMEVKREAQKTRQQEESNKRLLLKAKGETAAAAEFAKAAEERAKIVKLDAEKIIAENWNGVLPSTLIINGDSESDSPFLKLLQAEPIK